MMNYFACAIEIEALLWNGNLPLTSIANITVNHHEISTIVYSQL